MKHFLIVTFVMTLSADITGATVEASDKHKKGPNMVRLERS